ncbi:MAG TPA: VWA domain-containing protein, partial [bacterium]|nr:VWA domain-containing protein [bacterium]
LVLFTDRVEKFIPPKKGKKHVLRLIRELLMFEPAGGSTDIKTAMDFLGKILTRKTVVFLLSDFLSAGYEEALRMMNNRHDLVTISITDPREIEMPPIGFLELQDAETGEIVIVDTYDASIRQRLANTAATDLDQLTKSFKRMQVDHIPVRTDKPYIDPLVRFFQQRAKRY